MRLFAYGTLADPDQLGAVVGTHLRCRVLGGGIVSGILYDAGPFPALQTSSVPDDIVRGVVLELDDSALARLDAYEDVDGGLYVRQLREVHMDDGRRETAWVYVYNRSVAQFPRIAAWPPQRG